MLKNIALHDVKPCSQCYFSQCIYTGSSKKNAGIIKKLSLKNLLNISNDSSGKLLRHVWSFLFCSICRGRYRDNSRSRTKSAESYLELPLRWLLWSYHVSAGYPESFHHKQCSWGPPLPKKKVHWSKIWASGRPEDWSAPPKPGLEHKLYRLINDKSISTSPTTHHQVSISKTYVISPHFKTWNISICLTVFER
jgi:hypothetical protein